MLLVEDDAVLGDALRRTLTAAGYTTRLVGSGGEALSVLDGAEPDVVLLDMGLPDRDGLGVCREIRGRSRVPILAITGRGDVAARVQGLRSGADDHLVKPISTDELLARIEAVLRRSTGAAVAADVHVGDVTVHLDRRVVTAAGEPVALSRKEFDLLARWPAGRGLWCNAGSCWSRSGGRPTRRRRARWRRTSRRCGPSSGRARWSARCAVSATGWRAERSWEDHRPCPAPLRPRPAS